MATKPTHYQITVNRPFEHAKARFRPGARYTVTAKVYDQIKAEHEGAIKDASPVKRGK